MGPAKEPAGFEEVNDVKFMTRALAVTALIVLAAATAFANGGSDSKATEADGPVTITWWALSGGGGADNPRETSRREMIAEFEATHPGVTIDLVILENEAFKQKVQVAVQAGNPPDIFHSWGGGVMVAYAEAGGLRDITDLVESSLSKKIGMGALGVYGYDGTYWGAPYDLGAVGMWYNTEIFDELGLEPFETWDELLAAVPVIKNAGYVPIALGGGDKWPAHFWWVYLAMRIGGLDAFNAAYGGSGSFKDDAFVKAGEMLLQLEALDPFQTGYLGASYDDQSALVGNGQAAMELMGQWAPAVEEANSATGEGIGDKLAWFSFPAVSGGKGRNTDAMGGGNGYVVGANAPDEALEFLDFFLSKENNITMAEIEGAIPVVKGAEVALQGNENGIKIAQAVAEAEYYQLYYDQYLPPAVGEAVKDAVVALLAGTASPEEAAAMVDDAWQLEK